MSAMWEDMPGPDLELLRRANLCFQAYIFYHNPSRHTREGHCTACDADLWVSNPQRTITSDDKEFLNARHNESGRCPKCGNPVIYKQIGKSKSRSSLRATGRIVFILPVNENKVYARAFYIEKDYTNYRDGYIECMWQAERTRYIWQPGEYSVYKYDECRLGVRQNGSMPKYDFIRTSLIEPFTAANMGGDLKEYKIVNEDALKDCFLRYAQLDSFKREDAKIYRFYFYSDRIFKYLSLYCEHPQFEMLMKLGHGSFVNRLVYAGCTNGRYVKWDAKSPTEFFKLSKQEYQLFRTAGGGEQLYTIYKVLKRRWETTTFSEVKEYIEDFNMYVDEWKAMIVKHKISPVRYHNYITGKSNKEQPFVKTYILHRDYIKFAGQIGYDIKNEVIQFPKDLTKAHDTAHDLYKKMETAQKEKELEIKNHEMEKLYAKREKQYTFSDGEYSILQPTSLQEIIQEGSALHHCVGGYAPRHAEGKLTILFLRRNKAIDQPYQTIEMSGKALKQIEGYKNKTPLTESAQAFFSKWLTWVEAGSPRSKDGKPIIEADAPAQAAS